MSQTTPPTVDPLPAAPSTAAPSTFSALADAFLAALLVFRDQLVALGLNVFGNAVDAYNSAVSALASMTAAAISETNAANTASAIAAAAAAIAGAAMWVSGTTYAVGWCVYSPIDFRTYRRRTAGAGTTDPSQDSTNWTALAGGGLKTYTGTLDLSAYNVFMNYSGAVTLPDLTTVSSSFGLAAQSNSAAVPATVATSDGWSVATGFVAGTLKQIAPAICPSPTPHGYWGNLTMTPPVLGTSAAVGSASLTMRASVALSTTCYVYAFSDSAGTYVIALDPTTGLWGAPVTLTASTVSPGYLFAVSATSFLFMGSALAVAGSLSGLTITKGTNLVLTSVTDMPVQLTGTTYFLRQALTSADLMVLTVSGITCSLGAGVSSGMAAANYGACRLAPISATAVLVVFATSNTATSTLTVRVASISGTTITVNTAAVSATAAVAGNTGGLGSLVALTAASFMFCAQSAANSSDGAWYGITVSGTAVTLGALQISTGTPSYSYKRATFIWYYLVTAGTASERTYAIQVNSTTAVFVTSGGIMAVSLSGTTLTFGAVFTTNTYSALLTDMATGANIYAISSTNYSKLSVSGVTITAAYTIANSPLAIFSDTLTDKAVSYAATWYSWTGLPTLFFPIALDKYASVSSNVLKSYGSFA